MTSDATYHAHWQQSQELHDRRPYTGGGVEKAARTPAGCSPWLGSDRAYQGRAADALAVESREPEPWAWITPTCATANCLTADHLSVHTPIRLSYPRRLCIYCGRSAGTKDHLLPRHWTGDVRRRFTAIVPACGTCNSLLRDTLTWSITERRALCHARLRRHFAKVLRVVDRTPAELDEYGRTLRTAIADGMERKAEVERMLAWPEDPAFDLRALEHSGLPNAYVVGLLVNDDDEFRRHIKDLA